MVAVVTVVAGIATLATNKLQDVFAKADPNDSDLERLLAAWRLDLRDRRAALTRLKAEELDLLAREPAVDAKLLRGKNRVAGELRSIYGEPVALYVRQDWPKAKQATSLTLLMTADGEYVYRQRGGSTQLEIDGGAVGQLQGGHLRAPGAATPSAALVGQSDGRTVHVDRGERTLGILLREDAARQVVPRAFEFVDLREPGDRGVLEALTGHYLLTQNRETA